MNGIIILVVVCIPLIALIGVVVLVAIIAFASVIYRPLFGKEIWEYFNDD